MNIYKRVKADPADFFSDEEVRKAKEYQKPITTVGVVKGLIGLAAIVLLIQTGAVTSIADAAASDPDSWIPRLFGVLFLLLAVDTLVDLPFDIWMQFGHDKKWGFSTQTPGRFVGDLVKGLLVSIVLLGVLMTALWAVIRATDAWWIVGWIIFMLFSVVLAVLAPVVLMPLFNKFTPLDNEGLANKLRSLATKAGLNISGVQVMDASKRTKKDNAFFAGLGKTRRVVLFDNILEQPDASIESVVAHEMGHWKHKHIVQLVAIGTVTTFALFLLLRFVSTWDAALAWVGVDSIRDPASLPLVFLTFGFGSLLLRYVQAWHSRALERQADLMALELTGDPEVFSSMMRGLATKNLGDLAPGRLAYWKADHPPVAERLELAKQWTTSSKAGSQ